jgi:peptide/nickel transport system permease protein
MKTVGASILFVIVLAALAAPVLSPHASGQEFRGFLHAPPMLPHVVDAEGRWHAPFVYPVRLANRLEQRYDEDRSRRVPLVFFSGTLVRAADERDGPWLPLGSDSFGRDVLARILFGARASLGVAAVALVGTLFLGLVVGGLAGYLGGAVDESLMRLAEFILVLPTIYLVLALRAVLPLVLSAWVVFVLMAGIFALVGWPYVARGVRGVVAAERRREYAIAAVSLGAGHSRLLFRHLLPASAGFLATQATLLLPAFILAEATLSYVGLGFPEPMPSWGSMLHEAANVTVLTDFPWTLCPAVAIFLVVLGVNLVVQGSGASPITTAAIVPRDRYRAERRRSPREPVANRAANRAV